MTISCDLIGWYRLHKRDLPWRNTRNPYKIWLSEIILQQTRVDQGTPYYYRFIERFPNIQYLAEASEEQVLKEWQGLGYYSRARNLHKAAKLVVHQLNGKFPIDFQEIIKLPGVGEYTAAAIASFAYNQPHAVLDGNVFRVLSRLFNIHTPVNSHKAKRLFIELANSLLDKKDPAAYNQAIMELGATVCKPSNPACHICVVSVHCQAFQLGTVLQLPVKLKKLPVRNRYFNYLFIVQNDHIFISKRTSDGIWQNLYELPVIETQLNVKSEKIVSSTEWKKIFKDLPFKILSVSEQQVHKLSHQHIHYRTFLIEIKNEFEFRWKDELLKIQVQQVENYPVPKLIENILREKLEQMYSG
jgi:A/G-specific adenine glycosylase